MTYAALVAQARQVARVLRAARVGPEVPVAVCLDPSAALVVAALAVWEAGGVYVPLDPTWPRERLAFIVRHSGASVLITTRALQAAMEATAPTVLALDAEAVRPAVKATTDIGECVDPQQLACIIYRFGSTGRPNGVAVTHANLAQYLAWCRVAYSVELPVDALWQSSIGSDLSLTTMLTPLVTGGTVVMLPEPAPGVGALHRALQETSRRVLVKVTPSQLQRLETLVTPAEATRVAVLIVGGEALLPDTVVWWRANAPATVVINEYGSAETTVGCCTYFVETVQTEWRTVPIGRPIFNAQLFVVEASGEPAPPGVPGELYIGGAGVSRGYHGQPALTAERFVPDPLSGRVGARLYASGDSVRATADGTMELTGRRDRSERDRHRSAEYRESS